jgi:hypothetical protein
MSHVRTRRASKPLLRARRSVSAVANRKQLEGSCAGPRRTSRSVTSYQNHGLSDAALFVRPCQYRLCGAISGASHGGSTSQAFSCKSESHARGARTQARSRSLVDSNAAASASIITLEHASGRTCAGIVAAAPRMHMSMRRRAKLRPVAVLVCWSTFAHHRRSVALGM